MAPPDPSDSAAPTLQDGESVAPSAVPAGTTVIIRIVEPVSSSTATQGQFFPIELAEPILLGDREIVPAGVRGEGQVVHARHRGWGGGAGELILAARYLQWGERRLALRAFHLGVAGRDGASTSLITTMAVGVVGAFVTGRSANVPGGALATARLVEALPLEPVAEGASAQPTSGPVDGSTVQPSIVEDATAPATPTGE